MSFVPQSSPLSHNVHRELRYVSIIPLLTFPTGFGLLFAPPRAVSRVYFDPINYYFD